MNKKILLAVLVSTLTIVVSSCYNNKTDVLALPKVSFRQEVVPIIASGACGCHNNGQGQRAVQFSHYDTIFYDAILSRVSLFSSWVNGGTHPGAGAIDFEPNEKILIKKWIEQGAKDDAPGCTVTGTIRYTTSVLPIYTTSCKGSTCHGGIAISLDYAKLVADKSILTTMMGSGGSTGHPGGALSLSACTINTIKQWLDQGQLQ